MMLHQPKYLSKFLYTDRETINSLPFLEKMLAEFLIEVGDIVLNEEEQKQNFGRVAN
jgi:hypothetical protein